MLKKDCFAFGFNNKTKKAECGALTKLDCLECRFYQHKSEVENNPFYPDSYESFEAYQEGLKKLTTITDKERIRREKLYNDR